MQAQWHKRLLHRIAAIFLFTLFSISAQAKDIPLANEPVLDSGAAEPNIMLFIDSSGSMFDPNRPVPGTGGQTRIQVAKEAAIELVDSLENVRMGLAIFSGSTGANILVGVDDIDANRSTLINQINNIQNTGWTPLAEAMQQIGRYFVQGNNNTLTLHPDQANETKRSAYTVFDQQPSYAYRVSQRSPIQYYCQKSFIILLTDGQPSQDRDISASSGLQDYDGDCNGRNPPCENTLPGQPSQPSYDMKPTGGYTYNPNGGSDYIDDVVNALFDIDLRPDLEAPTGVSKKNNIITYPVGFADSTLQNDPLMADIAKGGGGEYIYAADSDALTAALNTATASILTASGAAGAASFSSLSLTQDTAAYLTRYNTLTWSGDVIKYNLDSQGDLDGIAWQAATILDNTSPSKRVILTYNRDTFRGVPFKNLADLSQAQQNDLTTGGGSQLGQDRINYLRGVRSNEGSASGNFRQRASVLGDIINSSVVYVGEPISAWPDTAPFPTGANKYSSFKTSEKNRTPVIYVGANDGMLHAFQASDGHELLAYIPDSIFSTNGNAGLHYLTDSDYEHRFYVDGTPIVSDAYIQTRPSGPIGWHTVLIGHERNGGTGYFALDITNPDNFSETNANDTVMWEFSSKDDGRLGKTYSKPVIGLMNNGRWAAIFGNGYNAPDTKTAQLFIVYLDGGLDGKWKEGRDYLVFDTKVGSNGQPNGMASPAAVDLDGNGTVDRIYAGDYSGNMWAIDVSSSNASNWDFAYSRGNRPRALFRSPGNDRAITTKPIVVTNPDVITDNNNLPNTIVMFGTGQLLASADKFIMRTETFYGIWDHGNDNILRSRLVEQTYVTLSGQRILTDNSVPYEASNPGHVRQGWYIDFTGGERIITDPLTKDGLVYFNTTIPNITDPCSSGGTGWLMVAKVENGGQPDEVVVDVNNDDLLTDDDKLNGRVVSGIQYKSAVPTGSSILGSELYTTLSNNELDRKKIIDSNARVGRLSWTALGKN